MISVAVRRRLGDFALDVAFEGPAGGVTVLFGPSGAGKSATLAAIAGSGPPTKPGERIRIVLDGRVLTDTAAAVCVPPRTRRTGRVFQDARLFPHLRVAANLRYGMKRAAAPHRIGFERVVEVLDIGHLLARGVADLSGGERQRVALGRALLSQPELLLLDEPLAALDTTRAGEVLMYIRRLNADFALPMVYVTHDAGEARRIADHVVMIEAGRVTAAGDTELLGGARRVASILSRDAHGTVLQVPGAVAAGDWLDITVRSRQ